MIKFAFKLYSAIAILSPWIFFIARITGLYTWPTHNTQIFIGLFVLSGIWMTFLFWIFRQEEYMDIVKIY